MIGHDDAAHDAEAAGRDGPSLRDAALGSGKIDAATFDAVVAPKMMVGDGVGGARPSWAASAPSYRRWT